MIIDSFSLLAIIVLLGTMAFIIKKLCPSGCSG